MKFLQTEINSAPPLALVKVPSVNGKEGKDPGLRVWGRLPLLT